MRKRKNEKPFKNHNIEKSLNISKLCKK